MTEGEAWAAVAAAGVISIMRPEEREQLWRVAPAGSLVIEVGTAYGGTAAFLALGGAQVITIDSWECGKQAECEAGWNRIPGLRWIRLQDCQGARQAIAAGVPLVQMPVASSDAAAGLLGVSAHLVIIDGAHSGQGPLWDLRMYAPLVEPGGTLAIDDVQNGHPDVTRGVVTWALEQPADTWRWVWGEPFIDANHSFTKLILLRRSE